LPEFAPPQVEIQAEALGLSAAEVEQLITVPLEQDLLNGIPWLDQIRSETVPGLSSIDLIFQRGTNILTARQFVSEHLSQAHALPQVGTPPVMVQPVSSLSRVMMIGLGAKDLSLVDLSILARWKIATSGANGRGGVRYPDAVQTMNAIDAPASTASGARRRQATHSVPARASDTTATGAPGVRLMRASPANSRARGPSSANGPASCPRTSRTVHGPRSALSVSYPSVVGDGRAMGLVARA
jgi:hypothetical protein